MDPSPNSYEDKPSSFYSRILWIALIVVEFLLGFRFALKFIGLDANTGLTELVYKITQPLASPFLAALGVYREEGSVLEWTTLIAMVVYWIIAWAIIKIFLTDQAVSTPESERKLK
ncbi:MAG: hypothetical protein NTZ84_03120 [Candidatus Nealsonbacteria bacterium]|nr:hypothetical protein [Candidatus Nealsonbacteria bacterium]